MRWIVFISLFLMSVVPAIRKVTLEPLAEFLNRHRVGPRFRDQILVPILVLLTFVGAFYALIGSWILFLEPGATWHWLTTGLDYPSALVGGVLGFCSAWSLRSRELETHDPQES